MSKITIQNKQGKLTISNRLVYPETINQRVLAAVNARTVDCILPVSVTTTKKETRVDCTVQGLVPIVSYYGQQNQISKDEFLDLVYRFISLFKECERNMIDPDNLDLRSDHIFITPQKKAVRCILWPLVNSQLSAPIHEFLQSLPYVISFDPGEDSAYLKKYIAFFKRALPFSLNSFEKMIAELQGRKIPDTGTFRPVKVISKPTISGSGSAQGPIAYDPFSTEDGGESTRYPMEKADTFTCPSCGSRIDAGSAFCPSCGAKLKPADKPVKEKPPARPQTSSGTINLSTFENNGSEPDDSAEGQPCCAYLINSRTREKRLIDSAVFSIGRHNSTQPDCDLLLTSRLVGRHHADIISRGSRFFLVDLNSKNGTLLNGRRILPQTEVELTSGAKISFADTPFTFVISVSE